MMCAVIILIIIIAVLVLRLIRYENQMKRMADILENTPAWSNQRLYSGLQTKTCSRLCNAINRRLEETQQNQINAEDAQRELKYLIASISHDIRTPLTSAMGYLQLIKNGTDERKMQEYQEVIERKLFDLNGMLDNLFLYSKLANDAVKIECNKIDICQVICEVLLGFEYQLSNTGIVPEIVFFEQSCFVLAEMEAVKRVCRNLIENALLYGKGDLKIVQKNNTISFSNHIEEAMSIDIKTIFSRFYRSDTARNSAHSGLGLAIVEQLVSQMGGTVEAELKKNYLTITIYWKV